MNRRIERGRRARRGAVILLVLVMIVLAAAMLARFIDRVSTELVAETRAAQAARLRTDLRSALDASLAVLAGFQATGGLHSPAQGWGDPLSWVDGPVRPGVAVAVRVTDESGKASLPALDAAALGRLLEHLGADPVGAAMAADAILAWTRPGHSPAFPANDPRRLHLRRPPHRAPGRPLASLAELASVPGAGPLFFADDGTPTALGRAFTESVSLQSYEAPNLHSATVPALVAAGLRADEARGLAARIQAASGGGGDAPVFRGLDEAAAVLGQLPPGLGVTARCLGIELEAREGATRLRWRAIVLPAAAGAAPRPVEFRETIQPRP